MCWLYTLIEPLDRLLEQVQGCLMQLLTLTDIQVVLLCPMFGENFFILSYSMHTKLFLSISLLSVVWITYSCTYAIMVFGASAVGCNENLILFQYLGCVLLSQ